MHRGNVVVVVVVARSRGARRSRVVIAHVGRGEVIVDIELDRRFVIQGDKKSAQEWGAVVDPLCALDDIAPFGASLDARSFMLELPILDEKMTGAFVSMTVQMWQALVRRRLGMLDDDKR